MMGNLVERSAKAHGSFVQVLPPLFLTIREAAPFLRCCTATMRRLAKKGEIPFVRGPSGFLIEVGELKTYLDRRTRAARTSKRITSRIESPGLHVKA